jgi:hypothetical protein
MTISITSIKFTGTNASNFFETNTCGTSVGKSASCTVTVTFKPKAKGSRRASLSFSDNGGGGPQTIPVSGTNT